MGFTISLSLILEDSGDIFFLITCCLGLIWGCLIDAMPAAARYIYSILGPSSGVAVLVGIQAGLFFKTIPINDFPFNIGFLDTHMSSLVTSFSFNTALFLSRNVVNAISNPDQMVVINSPVVSEKMNKVVSVFLLQ